MLREAPAVLIALALLIACVVPINAQSGNTQTAKLPEDARVSAMDAYLHRRVASSFFSGAVLVSKDGQTELRGGYGLADRELDVPIRPDSIFRIASLTKPVTAAAALALVERGKLSLDDKLCSRLPNCPEEWIDVTVRHLLTHTSGIPDLFGLVDDAPVQETRAAIDKAIAKAVEGKKEGHSLLDTKPGESYAYSNFNYVLLAAMMEVATGRYWEDILRQYVFEPAGMLDTAYDDVWKIVPRRVHGYRFRDGELSNIDYHDHSGYSAGGLRSTIDDLARFHRALVGGKLIGKKLVDASFTPYRDDYGYGWQIMESFGRRYLDHNGSINGFSSQLSWYPDDDLLIIVLANLQNESSRAVACDLAAMWFGDESHPIFDPANFVTLNKVDLDRLVGSYAGDDGHPRQISIEDGSLIYQRGDSQGFDLRAIDATTLFLARRPDIIVKFELDARGVATAFELRRCGAVQARAERR